jgi:hypothetical protein
MDKNNEVAYKHKIFEERVSALNDKIFAAIDGESVNVSLSSLLTMLLHVSQHVPPKDKFVIGSAMEDCMKIMGVGNQTHTIH